MDKTPITILQEVGTKLGALPAYTELSTVIGTHQNKFVFKVVWSNYSAEGTASSKKEAKQNAAKNMLLLLSSSKVIPETVVEKFKTSIVLPETSDTTVIKGPLNPVSIDNAVSSGNLVKTINTLSISDKDTKEEFTNYIGILNEYCQAKNLSTPVYEGVAFTGQHHLPQFTVRCTVGSVYQEGTANSKKGAKQNAAKKVIEDLKINMPLSNISNTETSKNYVLIDNYNYDEIKKKEVLTKYSQLKQKAVLYKNDISVQNYVEVLRNLYHNVPVIEKNEMRNMYQTRISIDPNIFKTIIEKAFKTSVEEINFDAVHGKFAIGYRLNTYPVISQIGISITKEQASIEALRKLLKFFFYF